MVNIDSKKDFAYEVISNLVKEIDLPEQVRFSLLLALTRLFLPLAGKFNNWNSLRWLERSAYLPREGKDGGLELEEVFSIQPVINRLKKVGINGPKTNFVRPLIDKITICMANGRLPHEQRFLQPSEAYEIERSGYGVRDCKSNVKITEYSGGYWIEVPGADN